MVAGRQGVLNLDDRDKSLEEEEKKRIFILSIFLTLNRIFFSFVFSLSFPC